MVDIGTGLGLVGFLVKEKYPKCLVYAIDNDDECIEYCKNIIDNKNIINYNLINSSIEEMPFSDNSFNKVLSRSSIWCCIDKKKAINSIYRILKNNGIFSMFEVINIGDRIRLYNYLDKKIKNYEEYKRIESIIKSDYSDPATNMAETRLIYLLEEAGFNYIKHIKVYSVEYFKYRKKVDTECIFENSFSNLKNMVSQEEKFLKYMSKESYEEYKNTVENNLNGKIIPLSQEGIYIIAGKNIGLKNKLLINLNIMFIYLSYIILNRLSYIFAKMIKTNNVGY